MELERLRRESGAFERDQGVILARVKEELLMFQSKATKAETELSRVQIELLEVETKYRETTKMLQEQK